MIEEQERQILRLRSQGMGYREIAATVNLSRDLVRYHCKTKGLGGIRAESDTDLKDKMANGRACAFCGAEIQQKTTGRPRRFCSELCRRSYWRIHRAELKKKETAIYIMECPYCHDVFQSYGNKTRKYCCHEHYILDRFGEKDYIS